MKKLIVLALIILAGGYLVLKDNDTSEVSNQDVKDNQEVAREEEIKDEDEEGFDTEEPEDETEEVDSESEVESTLDAEVGVEAEVNTDVESSASDYNDGTYTSDVSYALPNGGSHSMTVSLKVQNDVISDVNLTFDGENGSASSQSQVRFADAIDPFVITKDLDGITELSRIGGASLTTNAFNEAVVNIKANAS